MAKVLSMGDARRKKNESSYMLKLKNLDKIDLLQEMAKFQEEWCRKGQLDKDLKDRGFILFQCLIDAAETQELRDLCKNYLQSLKACKV